MGRTVTTWQRGALSALYTAAADDMEHRDYNNFQGGLDVWGVIHTAAWDLFSNPATEGVRRHVGVDNLNQWEADRDTVVKTLRALAEQPEQLDLLQQADEDRRLAQARRMVAKALGWDDSEGTLWQLTDAVEGRIKQMEDRNTSLAAEVEVLRRQLRDAQQHASTDRSRGTT
jgi:hypothetical protein